jgi:S1-C subfamily serine protease
MKKPFASRFELWQHRSQHVRATMRRALPFAVGVLVAVTALLLYNGLVPPPPQITKREVDNAIAQALASVTPRPPFTALVYRVIQPSLVLIQSQASGGSGLLADGEGTGVVINADGDILTSLHIVANTPSVLVTFADGTQSSAQVIGAQIENDIAVLRASQRPTEIFPATLGNPNAMRVGDEAFVVGHPFSLYGSMSAGVISGFERSFQIPETGQTLEGLIQIDAAVNTGSSGGPLLNRSGQVVGIVTALLNPNNDDVFIGIGFAVPITVAGGAAGLPPY